MTENPPNDDTAETRAMTAGDPLGPPPAAPPTPPAGGGTPPGGNTPPGGGTPPPGDPPPTPPGPPPAAGPPPGGGQRRFLRSRDDRMVAGVAGGLGAHLGIDASLVRLAFVALSLFGGAGVLLYIAAVLLVADAPAGTHAARPAPGDRNRTLTILGVVLLVLVAGPLLFVPAMFAGGILVPLAMLALLGILVAWLVTGRRPERDAGSLLKAVGLGLGVLVLIGVLAVASFWGAGLGGDVVIAALVIAAGVALLAGAALRPVRWLILPAIAVAIPAGFVAAAGIDLDGGLGDKTYRPGTAADVAPRYELGAGELVVDLRGADLPPGDRRVRMELGMGAATLLVDDEVCVATQARVGMGAVEFFDRDSAGVDIDVAEGNSAPRGATRILLDADVGLGLVEVRHTEPWRNDWDRDRDGRFDDADEPGNTACTGATN